jgi:hypothetical protein
MKNFKPGQKVAFISSTEKGTITKIIGDIIYVKLEDGFEIPAYKNDLIALSSEIVVEEEKSNEVQSSTLKRSSRANLARGIYLAFIQHEEEKNFFEGYLINFSRYNVAFHLVSSQGKETQSVLFEILPAGDAMLVFDDAYETLTKHQSLKIQFMIIDVEEHLFYEAPVISFDIKWNKLLTREVFQPNPFFDEEAYVVKIVDFGQSLKTIGESNLLYEKKHEKPFLQSDTANATYLIDRYQIDDETAEVDLHAEKLFPDYKKMLPGDIIRKQILFAKQCIDSARQKRLKRLVLIHGVGSGALKNELYNLLRKEDGILFGEASLLKYGVGAIEITFEG